MLKSWLAYYLLLFLAYFHKAFKDVCVLHFSVSLKNFHFYQQNMLVAKNQISKQKMLISLSVSLLESERIICFNNSVRKLLCKRLEEKISSVNYQNHHNFTAGLSNMKLTIGY